MRDAVEGDQSGPAARAPLNAMQRGFWAARRLHSGRALDNRFMKLEWRLALDLPNLERALEALVARTDALRLVFGEGEDGEPWQHAVPHLAPDLETRNFEAAADPEAEADAWLDSVCAEPFDLSRRPFRTALARLGPERWIWALCLHHIVTDRTSNEIMVRRLSDLYGEALTGRIAPAPPAPGFLDRPPADPPARPSSAAPPPPVRLYGVEGTARSTRMLPHRVLLGRERLAKAKAALGLKEGLPGARGLPRLFDLLATASAIHAVRVSGARVVTLGAPTHGRYAPESAEVAGPFIRVLPLTVEIPEGARVREALDAVRAARRRVFSAARAGRPPAPARFAATINFIATPMPDFHGAPSLERPAAIAPEAAGVDLALTVRAAEVPGDVLVRFAVNAEVAAVEPPASIAATWLRVLDAVLGDPEAEVDRVALLGPEALAAAVSATEAAFAAPAPEHPTVLHAMAAVAAARPEAPAVMEGDRRLDHAGLAARTAAAAGALAARGVGRGDVLPVTGRRSLDLVVALVAAARSGAAFCPLDPATPPERLSAILALTGAKALLVSDDAPPRSIPGTPVLALADLEAEGGAPPSLPGPEDPLYVMFTSGTTGEPKGVVVPHGAFMRYQCWLLDALGVEAPVWAFASSIGFEGVMRLFEPLISGGAVNVHPDRGVPGLALADALRADAADDIFGTPSHLRMIVDGLRPVRRLRRLVAVGEVLDVELARRLHSALGGGVEIQNWYGPVEGVMSSTMHRFDPARDRGAAVPIGRPGPGVAVHVLDAGMNPVPRGVAGEIALGGTRLSQGYLGRPDLTAAAFVPDPFRPGARLYRTGDLGLIDGSGALVHRGRIDDQIKIHGMRVEPSEIEAAIAAHPSVSAAAVRLEPGPPQRLRAWVVASSPVDPVALCAFLARRLPEALIPADFVPIDALPLSSNGKVTRCALPAGDAAAPPPPATAAKDPLTCEILELCRRRLRDETLGPDDPLDHHGADSLVAVQIVLATEARFGVTLQAVELGGPLTPATLAARVDEARRAAAAGPAAPALIRARVPEETEDPLRHLALTASRWPGEPFGPDGLLRRFGAAGARAALHWCFNAAEEAVALAGALPPDRPLVALRSLAGVVETKAERRRLERPLAERYADAILAVHDGGPILLGGNCQSGRVALQVARRLEWLGAEVPQVILLDALPPFPFPGRVALIFGRRSRDRNPLRLHPHPERGWRRLWGEIVWEETPGRHGRFFEPPNLAPLAERILRRLDEAEALVPFPLPPEARKVRLRALDPPKVLAPGERFILRVEVTNAGSRPWREAAFSALHLVARWPGVRGGRAARRGASEPLAHPLAPGAAAVLALSLRAPKRPGRLRLELDMAEEGIGRFGDDVLPPLSLPIEVAESDRSAAPARRRPRLTV